MQKSIILDDGIEYIIFKDKIINDIKYTLFVNINDDSDICFRKTIIMDNEEYYIGLDNEEELNKVIIEFAEIQ